MGMPDQGARIRRRWERGVGGGIGQRVGVGGNWLREDECEVLVEAGDEVVLRAEVRGELEASEGQCPEKSGAGGAHKPLDQGTAENTEERLCDSPLVRGIAGRRESVDSEKHLQQIVAMA